MKLINIRVARLGLSALALSALLGVTLIGCATSGDDRSSSASKNEVTQNEKKFRFRGTVVYHRAEGGYYSLVSNSGEEYYPLNLDSRYQKSGLRVQVFAEGRGYARGGQMRAIQVFDIARLSSQ